MLLAEIAPPLLCLKQEICHDHETWHLHYGSDQRQQVARRTASALQAMSLYTDTLSCEGQCAAQAVVERTQKENMRVSLIREKGGG